MSFQPATINKCAADGTISGVATVDQLSGLDVQVNPASLAVVALGANLASRYGAPADTLRAVIPALQKLSDLPVVMSGVIETEPEDCPPGSPRFANAVAVLRPLAHFNAISFLVELQALEAEFGRQRKGLLNEARVLDLDLISFADETAVSTFLTLPHPRARDRLFVMQPLAQLWPGFCFPGDSLTAAERVLLLKAGR